MSKEKEHKMWKENITPDLIVEIQQAPLKTHVEILHKFDGGCLHLLEDEAIEVMRFLMRTYRPDNILVPEDHVHFFMGDLDDPDPKRAALRQRTLERAKEVYEKHIATLNEKCDRCGKLMVKSMYCTICLETHIHSFK